MKKVVNIRSAMHVNDLNFEDLYEDISNDWEIKAARLQARRWRKLKHEEI